MIRVALFLIAVAALALGAAWFADRPGDVAVTWLGYRIETSVTVALAAVTLVVIAAIFIWSVLRFLMRSPQQVSLLLRNRRTLRGYHAISRGLIAIGAGDTHAARRSASEARRLAPHEPLALLLEAQAAQLADHRADAEQAFRAMADRPDTRLLGLRGLFVEAQRRDDTVAAQHFAETAAAADPGLNWASQAVLAARCSAGDWGGALAVLDGMKRSLDKARYRRQRAVLLTARAIALADNDRNLARELSLEAVKLAPGLVPAAVLAGRQLAEAGERRKATKILDAAWRANPHPDLADAYAHTRLGSSARERLARIRALAGKVPQDATAQARREAALALARAALDAREFDEARSALDPYLPQPTRRVAMLMAEIEEEQHGDDGRARQWTARAVTAAPDPAWTADGVVSDRWLPASPVTARLDAFEWKVPVAEIGIERPDIDITHDERPVLAETALEAPSAPPALEQAAAVPAAKNTAEPVIPLIHAPDDPGPDHDTDAAGTQPAADRGASAAPEGRWFR